MSSSILDFAHGVLVPMTFQDRILAAHASSSARVKDEAIAALIAIVDDEALVRMSLERLVKSAGYRCQSFASAEDFLQFGNREATDCLILDLMLPGMTGLDLQRQLADEGFQIPIVFISAHDSPRERARAIQGGAITYLVKPFDGQDLLEAVHSAVK
ncbi:MAG: response regulator transcription factor [Candidatus Angelobacter sp.]